jgi:hypothetical protein
MEKSPMSDTESITPDQDVNATVEQPEEKVDDLGDPGKKALDAERTARKAAEKSMKDLAAKVKAFEDAQKSDADKASERIADLEKQAAKALRYEAAESAGLPLKLAARLQGDSLDDMIADAKALKELIGVSDDGTPPPVKKGPHVPSEGKTPNVPSIDQQIADAIAKGDLTRSIALKQQRAAQSK